MDDRGFDAFTRTLTNGGSRRGILQGLGAGAVATVCGRLGPRETAEAKNGKKKNKRCKGNTTKCGKKACCRADQRCVGGKCVDDVAAPECVSDAECIAGQLCQDGICVGKGVE